MTKERAYASAAGGGLLQRGEEWPRDGGQDLPGGGAGLDRRRAGTPERAGPGPGACAVGEDGEVPMEGENGPGTSRSGAPGPARR